MASNSPATSLITHELEKRGQRLPDHALEALAYRQASELLGHCSPCPMQMLANGALQLARGESAGVFLSPASGESKGREWFARDGRLTAALEGSPIESRFPSWKEISFAAGPELFRGPCAFLAEAHASLPIHETLTLPFSHSDGREGILWIVHHEPGKEFDAEDARLVQSFTNFLTTFIRNASFGSTVVLRRQAEENEAKLKTALDQLGFALADGKMRAWHVDLRANLLTSEGLDLIYGENVDGDAPGLARHFFPEDRAAIFEAWRIAIESRATYVNEHRIRHADGSERWVLARGAATFASDGKPLTFNGVMTDITDQRHSHDRLQHAYEELADFFRKAPVAMAIFEGADHRFRLANEPYERMVGRSVLGKSVSEAFRPEEIAGMKPLLEEVYRTGESRVARGMRMNLMNEQGSVQQRFFNVGYHPFRDGGGTVRTVLALHEDVTTEINERKAAQEQEALAREVANAMPQIVWSANWEGRVDWCNQRWRELGGPGTGRDWEQCAPLHPDDAPFAKKLWQECLESGHPFQAEYRFLRHSDASYRWHLGRALPVRDASGQITRWIGTDTDVHDQTLLVHQLEEEKRLRERFVAALSHDLRTPLTAAKLSAQLLSRPGLAHRTKELSSRIVDSIDRADRMIRDILDVGRIRAGEPMPMKLVPCDLREVLTRTVDALSPIYGERLRVSAPDSEVLGYWDSAELQRVIENLVNNASKYGTHGGPITMSIGMSPECVRLSVHNQGNPISAEKRKALFEIYCRSGEAERGDEIGWGIGLTLVQSIAEAHRGSVNLDSSEQHGTTFTVVIPWDSRQPHAECG